MPYEIRKWVHVLDEVVHDGGEPPAVPLRKAAPQLAVSTHPDYLSLTPARHDTDGFFAAIMQRDALPLPE